MNYYPTTYAQQAKQTNKQTNKQTDEQSSLLTLTISYEKSSCLIRSKRKKNETE